MIIAAALLGLSLTSSAHAEDPRLPLPILGSNFVIMPEDCGVKVVGSSSVRKTAETIAIVERAKSECFAAKALRDDKARRDIAASARSVSEDGLIAKLDQENGGFEYVSDHNADGSDHIRILGGATAVAAQFITRVNGFDPSMSMLNSGDPSMVLSNVITTNGASRGGGTLYLYPTTATAVPAATTIPVADGSALSACQTGLKTATGLLAECRGGK